MTGAKIVAALLRSNAALVTAVPLAQIKRGSLPENCALPCILIRTVSSVERQKLKRGTKVVKTDRVSVLVRAATYDEQDAIVGLVGPACLGRTGNVGGGTGVSTLNAGLGPDVRGPGNTFEQTQDVRITFETDA